MTELRLSKNIQKFIGRVHFSKLVAFIHLIGSRCSSFGHSHENRNERHLGTKVENVVESGSGDLY